MNYDHQIDNALNALPSDCGHVGFVCESGAWSQILCIIIQNALWYVVHVES